MIDFEFQLRYDTELVEFQSAEATDSLLGDIEITPKNGAVHFSYTRTSANLTSKTEFATLTFLVKQATSQRLSLSLQPQQCLEN
jgi:hypothetical protein